MAAEAEVTSLAVLRDIINLGAGAQIITAVSMVPRDALVVFDYLRDAFQYHGWQVPTPALARLYALSRLDSNSGARKYSELATMTLK
ncbi:hypothetical protein ACP70R_044616 [Stipagrostis hirtigluma subsp. patula]